jgi:hypothetical protein
MMNLSGSLGPVEIEPARNWKGKSMRDIIGLIFGAVFLFIGAWILNNGISGRDTLQAETIAGAVLLSLGVVTLGIVLRGWLKWKRELKKYREG